MKKVQGEYMKVLSEHKAKIAKYALEMGTVQQLAIQPI